ncbi:prepilin peptidase [Azorhizobium sp. AG788]|uniref:prepilin peptidase n=1 Tax=Azorhizobium sp. AG788 TaxID=2183897 RepID=UPI00313A095E
MPVVTHAGLPWALMMLGLMPVALLVALASDLTRRIIPNGVVVALVLGLLALAALGRVPDLNIRLLLAGATLAVGFALFAEDVIGAGDAKLAAATALWLDPSQFPLFVLLCGGLGGALVAAATLSARRGDAAPGLWRGLPYGVALAGAGLALYPSSSLMAALPAALFGAG